MHAETIASSAPLLAQALLSPLRSTLTSFLTTYASPALTYTDPLLSPSNTSILGLPAVRNLLALESCFKQDVELLDVSWDQGTRELVIDSRTTWVLPGVGLARLVSEGRTTVWFEGRKTDESGGGGAKERLELSRIQGGEAADVRLAKALPRVLAYCLSLLVALLLPLLASLLAHLLALPPRLSKTASRRPSGPLAALLNPLDTAAIALANVCLFGLALGRAALGWWAESVGKGGIVLTVNLPHPHPHPNIAPRSPSPSPATSKKRPATSPQSSNPKHARVNQPPIEQQQQQSTGERERYPHHDEVVPEVSFSDAIKSGVAGLDDTVPSPPLSPPARAHEASSGTDGNGDERYPHHDEVVPEISFSDAIKSGVAGLDDKVGDPSEGEQAGQGQQQQQQQEQERYPHHDEVVDEVSFASAVKSGVEGLDDRVESEPSAAAAA